MKKASTDYLVFAENVISSGIGEKQTIVNIFDEVQAPTIPVIQTQLWIAGRIIMPEGLKKGDKVTFALRVTNPAKEILPSTSTFELIVPKNGYKAVNLSINASGMPLQSYGDYTFDILLDNQKVGSRTLLFKPTHGEEQ